MSGVVLDLVAPQSPSYRGRGIARHGLAFADALVTRHPHLVEAVLTHPELPPAPGMELLEASGKLRTEVPPGEGGIFHVTSPFEPELPARTLWPPRASARRMRLAVTVYDLIPDVFPDMYLQDPGLRRRWRCGREVVRVADHVFAISASAGEDVLSLLGVPAERMSVIGSGVDDRFGPTADVAAAHEVAAAGVGGLAERFVVCNGAIDPRKNLPRLVEAFARLPDRLDDVELVLVCRATPPERNHFMVMADRLGIGGRVRMPGFVSDEALVALYQSCVATVFPSLYEGYGLPVIEARACGALVVAGDNSSLREITPPMARFDATDVDAIASVVARVIDDEGYRGELARQSDLPLPTWAGVADAAAAGYEAMLTRDRATARWTPGWRARPRIAVVEGAAAPGGSDQGGALATRLAADADVTRFAAPPDRAPLPEGVLPVAALERVGRWGGGWDAVAEAHPSDSDASAVDRRAASVLGAARASLSGH